MVTRMQTTRKRTLIILGAVALGLAVALSALFFGGPRPGSAAWLARLEHGRNVWHRYQNGLAHSDQVLNVSYLAGFPPADLEECGPAVIVHAYTQAKADEQEKREHRQDVPAAPHADQLPREGRGTDGRVCGGCCGRRQGSAKSPLKLAWRAHGKLGGPSLKAGRVADWPATVKTICGRRLSVTVAREKKPLSDGAQGARGSTFLLGGGARGSGRRGRVGVGALLFGGRG